MSTSKRAYPRIGASHWWTLRSRFKTAPPRGKLTAETIVAVMAAAGINMSPTSAQKNVVPPLVAVGLIDKDGNPIQDLIEQWRHDDSYENAVSQIRDNMYPTELIDAFPHPTDVTAPLISWFARDAKVGDGAARQMAQTFVLLNMSLPESGEEVRPRITKPKTPRESRTPSSETTVASGQSREDVSSQPPIQAEVRMPDRPKPTVHIDVQVHISPESSDQQVESIFRNMAKYLYDRE